MEEIVSKLFALIFIVGGVVFFNKQIGALTDQKHFLAKTLFTILALMTLLFMVDKLFYSNRDLLDKDSGASLFSLIEKLTLLIAGAHFANINSNKN